MLIHPDLVFTGVQTGLNLWYNSILPCTFPFMIITSILRSLRSTSTNSICYLGLLCGLPVGANLVCQEYKSNTISIYKANQLLCFCNIASPMFIIGYVWNQALHKSISLLYFLITIYLPIIIYYFLSYFYFRILSSSNSYIITHIISRPKSNKAMKQSIVSESRNTKLAQSNNTSPQSKTIQKSQQSLQDVFLNCLRIIFFVGIYIILFCILINFIDYYSYKYAQDSICSIFHNLTSCLEITNGIHILSNMNTNSTQKIALISALTSFGGVCSLFQTQSVISETGLSFLNYTITKIIFGICSYILAILLF